MGRARTYPPSAEPAADTRRSRYIQSRAPPQAQGPPAAAEAGTQSPEGSAAPWLSGFRPRERVERVRNCAALPRAFRDRVVLRVATLLLGARGAEHGEDPQAWNPGGEGGRPVCADGPCGPGGQWPAPVSLLTR